MSGRTMPDEIDTLLAASDAEILADVADPRAAADEARRIFEQAAIEAAARAIYDADNGIDGDCIGEFIYDNFRINGPVHVGVAETLAVCRLAATAAIRAYLAAQPAEATAAEMREMLP